MSRSTAIRKEALVFLPTGEAADYLNEYVGGGRSYTPAALKALRRQHKGPPYYRNLGKQVLYAVPDLDRYIQSCRVVPEKCA
jgi:hypothetical protein